VNVLVIQRDGAPDLVAALLPKLDEPIARWRAGQRLILPSVAGTGTMILQDVGALARDDQRRLLDWLERTSGRTQVVSTSRGPLLPRVLSGAFLELLYYRLNTVCVDTTAA
jgi:transcriptional regulator of acetoin/glycerol metabolism